MLFYLREYSCKPPPLFLLYISIIQVKGIFYEAMNMDNTGSYYHVFKLF